MNEIEFKRIFVSASTYYEYFKLDISRYLNLLQLLLIIII